MISSRTGKWCLAGIIALASALRLYRLSDIPPGFYQDEASAAYNAWSILLTGKDIYGVLPLFYIRGLDAWEASLHCFTLVPSLALLGLNVLAARLPAALFGTLTIPLTYLTVRLRAGRSTALWAAFLLAIAPWHLHLSRYHYSALLPFFSMLGLYFFFLGLAGRQRYLLLSTLAFGLGFYTYPSARVFIPILYIGLLCIYRDQLASRRALICACVLLFLLFMIPTVDFAIREPQHFFHRYRQTTVLSAEKPWTEGAGRFLKSYGLHFSPAFLFLTGDTNPRHHPRGFGQLYLFELPLIVLGLTACMRRIRIPDAQFLLFWLLASAVPAGLTHDGIPHAQRAITAIPLYQTLSALGITTAASAFTKTAGWKRSFTRCIVYLYAAFAAASAGSFIMHYFSRYPVYAAFYLDYGWDKALGYAQSAEHPYDRVFLTSLAVGQPTIYPPFYLNYPPDSYRRARLEESAYRIIPPEIMPALYLRQRGHNLFIVRAEELPGVLPRAIVYFPDGRIAFKIIERNN
jgi:4-amino-4-deoxy-L-arabinose transferase-like glycosyltransferase